MNDTVVPYGALAVQFYDKKFEKLQNRAVRIIACSLYNAQTSPLLKQLRLPSIQDMIQQEAVAMVHKAINTRFFIRKPLFCLSLNFLKFSRNLA